MGMMLPPWFSSSQAVNDNEGLRIRSYKAHGIAFASEVCVWGYLAKGSEPASSPGPVQLCGRGTAGK